MSCLIEAPSNFCASDMLSRRRHKACRWASLEASAASLALDQSVADHARARHPIGMADGDRTAIDIIPLGIDAEPVSAIESLNGERLVELPQTDVVDLEPMLLQQLRHREDRTNSHLVRSAAGDRNPTIGAEWLQPTALSLPGFHQH